MIGIIPAAGLGTRFNELGKHYSKCILPYDEKPILIHNIEWLFNQGCDRIFVVANEANQKSIANIIRLYYPNMKDIEICIQYAAKGLSDAIYRVVGGSDEYNIANESVLIVLGDIIVKDDINLFKNNDCTISVKEVSDYKRWCMVRANENGFVTEFYDKPLKKPPTNYAVSGVYYFSNLMKLKDVLEEQFEDDFYKEHNKEFQISYVLGKMKAVKVYYLEIVDFGTLDEYLQNRNISPSRSFNKITAEHGMVTKSSPDTNKIANEITWYKNIPDELKLYTPKLISYKFWHDEEAYYIMEQIYASTLREIYIFIDSSAELWETIFKNIFKLLDEKSEYDIRNDFLKSTIKKTFFRVQEINIPVEPLKVQKFLKKYESVINNFIDNIGDIPCAMHGDFCFSNIFYDIGSDKITMIDPRGDLFGSEIYEVAKLMHSVIYDYDFIDLELYILNNDQLIIYNDGKHDVKQQFMIYLQKNYSNDHIKVIKYVCAGLFLSMIPLHDHNRNNQIAFYKIFCNIYEELMND